MVTLNLGVIANTSLVLLLCFGYAPQLFAQGGPPMLTDDPDTPGAGVWEINTAYT